jgi:glycyl-tRNA synthetase
MWPTAWLNSKRSYPNCCKRLRLTHGPIEVHGTPRRLVVLVHNLEGRQADLEMEAKGPPADRAFDADGRPTKAAIGFARSKGVQVADLRVVEEEDKRYVAAVIREEGRPTAAVLAEALPGLIADIKFQKSMRWNETNVAYSRPLRWLLALFGPDVIPFTYAGLGSDRFSYGLRPYGSPQLEIKEAASYRVALRKADILLEQERRERRIQEIGGKLAAEMGGTIPDDPELLNEVANLVERPTPLRGRFDKRFLQLPAAVLVAVMRKHQRYFPVYNREGALMPYFIGVRNGDERHLDIVVEGNEHVIRARFADAEFFYQKDTKQSLADFLPQLSKLTFQTKLGSMLDKTKRLEQLTPQIAAMLGLSAAETAVAARAAALAKADLVTSMVVEMTALQGIMGGHYARLSGEPETVAAAIAEQYEAVSRTKAGLALALADRLDSLIGLFAAGLAPKGSNDPFALRRAALHIIENLTANQVSFDLRRGLAAAARLLPLESDEAVQAEVVGFINGRLEGVLRDQGYAASVVKAVLAEQTHDPYAATKTAAALAQAITEPDWPQLLDAYARCVRIVRSQTQLFDLRPADFALAEEKALLAAYETAVANQDGTIATFVANLRQMTPIINQFFDNVLVMDENEEVRHNRLALMQHIAALTKGLADLSELEGF